MGTNKYEVAGNDASILIERKDGAVVRVLVSPESIPVLSLYRWRHNAKTNRVQGRIAGAGGESFYIHRVLVGAENGQDVDHVNGDPLDNRMENLRICTHKENMQNRRNGYGEKALPRGVSVAVRGRRSYFKAEHKINGANVHIGYFKTVEDADAAAKAWRDKHMPFG